MQERLKEIMIRENLSAAQLAKIMDINPSTISHITIGRSSPKMDFIQKLLICFPRLNPNWVLLGKGEMYLKTTSDDGIEVQKVNKVTAHSLFSLFDDEEMAGVKEPEVETHKEEAEIKPRDIKPEEVKHAIDIPVQAHAIAATSTRKIEQILVFYSDKSYEQFLLNE